MVGDLLIYGSYGYTGTLIAETAVERGLEPVVAGRRAEAVEAQATAHDLDHRVFSLEHPRVVDEQLADVDAVLHCAGPFGETAAPLQEACLRTGTDYLDIAGQVRVLEETAQLDREAEQAGVVVLPGVGFDVAPTDCLAAYLKQSLPGAKRLTLALDGFDTYSPGTVKSIIASLDLPGAVREDGVIRSVPAAWRTGTFDFGRGPKTAVSVPWGDVSMAYYTTGIPTIETYATVPEFAVGLLRRTRPLTPLLASRPAKAALARLADAVVAGPSEARRSRSVTRVYGSVVDDDGNRAAARLYTPDAYDVTAATAVESARRVLEGELDPGFQTPGAAFGPDFVLSIDGVEREDVETPASTVRATESP